MEIIKSYYLCEDSNMFSFVVLLLMSTSVLSQESEYPQFKIGGIFYKSDDTLIAAFETSAKNFNFTPSVRAVSARGKILELSEHVCSLAYEGVIGIIDGTGGLATGHIQSVCDMLDLPHVVMQDVSEMDTQDWFYINMFPSSTVYNQILPQIVEKKQWQNVTLLYVKGHSLDKVNSILKMGNFTQRYTISVRELSGDDYRDVLIDAKQNGYVNFIVDCPSENIEQFLKHAQQVALMADEHSYIFLSPDLFTVDLTRYQYGGVNITGFRLVDLSQPDVWDFTELINNQTESPLLAEEIKTKTLLINDAFIVFKEAIKKVKTIEPKSLSCEQYEFWPYGSSLLNFMRTNEVNGLTRNLHFDGNGERDNVYMEILELTPAGNQTIGNWNMNKMVIDRPKTGPANIEPESIMKNKTFKVLITLVAPYGYIKENTDILTGNDQYEGFSIDLIAKLAEMLGFYYEFSKETTSGNLDDKTKKWDGMVKQIMEETADFGICDFTVTALRESVIDFSNPFMSLGIGILYKEPSKQPPAMFSFMEVFSDEIWGYMLLVQLALGVIMIFVGRISHKEWQNPVPCVEQPEELSNQFSFANSIWLIIGSVMQQGSEIAPIALAPRMITSVWWFFTMVMVASYTGTLVAVLTTENNVYPFKSVEEMYNYKGVKYGATRVGSTIRFLKDTEIYKKIHEKMISQNWVVESNEEGIKRAETENYAMFMESTAIEYYKERHCDLLQIGDLLDSKNYAIGMKKGSIYKKGIDDAILKLKESGELQKLKDLWWKEKRGGGKCEVKQDEEPKQLGMKNMTGAFVVLGAGLVIGLLISILDMLWGVFKRTVKYNTTFRYELVEELKFVIQFNRDVKPVRRPTSSEGSTEKLSVVNDREGKDELQSLRSIRSSDTHRTQHSHKSKHSSRSQSVAFARQREYL